MSDIQDLIHKTSMDCIERGKIIERERIIKLLEEWLNDDNGDFGDTLKLIKGETKSFLTASQVEQMVDEMLEE